MEVLLSVLIVAAVAAFVSVPLRRSEQEQAAELWEDPELADLQARKAAKYREIRDTELDRAQGKITDAEFARQDAELRAEAIAILKSIDAREERVGSGSPPTASS